MPCMKRFLPVFVLLAAPLFAQPTASQPSAPKNAYLHCGTLYDGKSDNPQKNVWIRISDEKIVSVGPAGPPPGPPPGFPVTDLSREVCLPGLIDTHTHILLQGDITAADYDVQLLKQSVAYRTILATVAASARWSTASPPFATWKPKAPVTPMWTCAKPSAPASFPGRA